MDGTQIISRVQIRKRNGKLVDFNKDKITGAIYAAHKSVRQPDNILDDVAECGIIANAIAALNLDSVEKIQDAVEVELMRRRMFDVAKAYIKYRHDRELVRLEKCKILNKQELDDVDKSFSPNALNVLASRYLLRNEKGEIIETVHELFMRVAIHVALPEIIYDERVFALDKTVTQRYLVSDFADILDSKASITCGKYEINWYSVRALWNLWIRLVHKHQMKLSFSAIVAMLHRNEFPAFAQKVEEFYNIMVSKDFIPNSPTLMNAGAPLGQLSACFVLGLEDSLESIMDCAKDSAKIFQSGGGIGVNYTPIRPEGDQVRSTSGVASGPCSFMNVVNTVTEVVKQGGKRRGANMAILNCVAGDTLISTLEDKMMIKNLVGKKPYLYCLNEGGEIRIRQPDNIVNSGRKNIVRILFDDDSYLDCTPDHRVMLADGGYKTAGELKQFDSVMAFYKATRNGRYFVWATRRKEYPEHILALECKERIMVSQEGEKRSGSDLCVHHIDGNCLNNVPTNLESMTISEHSDIHSQHLLTHQQRIANERRGKSIEEVYGIEKTLIWKQKMSDAKKGREPWNKDNHKVISVTSLGISEVFDVVMSEYHNFVANGVFVHNCNHPDIEKFVTMKTKAGVMENFNVSVGMWGDFWDSYFKNEAFTLVNPNTKQFVAKRDSQTFLQLIAASAWASAEPGLIFFDNMNKYNPVMYKLGNIQCTNPCGEIGLYDYEPCNLGSINLSNFVTDKCFDYGRFVKVLRTVYDFLDNIIDVNVFALDKIETMSLRLRRIGIGVMGLADMLSKMGIAYDSKDAYDLVDNIGHDVSFYTMQFSSDRAKDRGSFDLFDAEEYIKQLPIAGMHSREAELETLKNTIRKEGMRNVAQTTIAPTGSISMIADTSSGIEPNFALVYDKQVAVGTFLYTNELLVEAMSKAGIQYSEDLKKKIADNYGSCQGIEEIPAEIQKSFRTTMDIHWKDHLVMQAVWQKWINNAISKTINMPEDATVKDVQEAYELAHELGLKGITVYRDNSRHAQVLHVQGKRKKTSLQPSVDAATYIVNELGRINSQLIWKGRKTLTNAYDAPPELQPSRTLEENITRCCDNENLVMQGGCMNCTNCGYSACHVG